MCIRDRENPPSISHINLADIPLPNGILHADKMRIHEKPFTLTLGAYGFPKEGNVQTERRSDGTAQALSLIHI